MKILISAAETSSDAHAAELLRALRAQLQARGSQESLEAFGIGGPKLQAEGLRTIVDARELLAMGFSEILSRLPRILRALSALTEAAARERPDVAVVVDYPDFHFKLAKRLHALGIPVIYYIPPKVWVWRKGRIKFLKAYFTKLLCILPFEVPFYNREKVAVKYVGNPLVDELPLALTFEQAREKLGISQQETALLLMAGSRPDEHKRHLPLVLQAAERVAERLGATPEKPLLALMPFPTTADLERVRARIRELQPEGSRVCVRLSQGDAPICMRAANAGMIKSGTSTLEAALMGCAHFIFYKASWLTEWIFRYLIRYRGPVGLVNLVYGWKPGVPYLIPEIIAQDVSLEALTEETISLLTDSLRRAAIEQGLAKVRAEIVGGQGEGARLSPSAQAAIEVLETCAERRGRS